MMTPDSVADRPLWMTLGLGEDHDALLALDLRDPSHLCELSDLNHLDDLPAAAFIVVDGDTPNLTVGEAGRVFVPRAFFWSLLAPAEAGRRRRLRVHDRLVAEQRLRREGRRAWDGIAAWAVRDEQLRRRARDLLAPWSTHHAALIGLIEALATRPGADPFAGWAFEDAPLPGTPRPAPLPLPNDADDLEAWMADPEGLGRLYGDGFRPRIEQGDMAHVVHDAFHDNQALLLEAGTGVGKTLGYLVPLLATLAASEARGVVSTHTRALQAQILDHDLPRLHSLAPDLKARRLMGRGNYLCRTRRVRFLRRQISSLVEAWAQLSFELWLDGSLEGMREEVEDHPAMRSHLTDLFDSPEPCSPAVCYGRQECHVQRARRLAREADLVIVNHALLMNDCAAKHLLVGEYRYLVVDEAHRLPAVALDTFSINCDHTRALVLEDLIDGSDDRRKPPGLPTRIASALARLGPAGEEAGARAVTIGTAVLAVADDLRRWLDALSEAYQVPAGGESSGPSARTRVYDRLETFGPLSEETSRVLSSCAESGRAQAALAASLENLDEVPEDLAEDLATLGRTSELVQALEEDLYFLTSIEDEEWVVWLDPDASGRFKAAGATRLDAGDLLREQWMNSKLNPVVTSATLGVGEDLSYMARELGLTGHGRSPATCIVPSPFDVETNTRYLVPSEFPAPNDPASTIALAKLIDALLRAVPRKAMVLFTSYRALKATRNALGGGESEHTFRTDTTHLWRFGQTVVLSQGDGVSPAELLARFRQERRAVLLGTNTFWEGVDLPGKELEILIIPRLPFLVPTDPWVDARSDRMKARGENPFVDFMVRDAVLKLRQGTGRLLRGEDDRGVVILLDTRLHTKPYGMTFLKALPVPVHFCAGVEDVVTETVSFFEQT